MSWFFTSGGQSVRLWVMPCRATQDGWVMVESFDSYGLWHNLWDPSFTLPARRTGRLQKSSYIHFTWGSSWIFKNKLLKIHPQACAAWESDLPKTSCGCGWYYPMIPGCQQPSVFFLVSESSFQPQPLSEPQALISNCSGYPRKPLFLLLWARSLIHLSSQTCAHLDSSFSQPLLLLGQGRLRSIESG